MTKKLLKKRTFENNSALIKPVVLHKINNHPFKVTNRNTFVATNDAVKSYLP